MKSIISAILAASLVGCASPPAVYNVEKTRPLTAPYDVAWDKLVAFFATNNLQIKNIAKDSGVIYAEMLRVDGRFADCGSPGLVRVIEQRTVFNVFMSRSKNEVTVTAEFTQRREFPSNNFYTVTCNSTGKLESMVLNAIEN